MQALFTGTVAIGLVPPSHGVAEKTAGLAVHYRMLG